MAGNVFDASMSADISASGGLQTQFCAGCTAKVCERNVRILQNWWHVDAVFPPNPAYNIRQVMDVYIPEGCLYAKSLGTGSFKVSIGNMFSGMRIYARNSLRNELPFLEVEQSAQDDASNKLCLMVYFRLCDFPVVSEDGLRYYYLKLELEYAIQPDCASESGCDVQFDSFSDFSVDAVSADAGVVSCPNYIEVFDRAARKCYVNDLKRDESADSGLIKAIRRSDCPRVFGWLYLDVAQFLQPEFYLTFPAGWECDFAEIKISPVESISSDLSKAIDAAADVSYEDRSVIFSLKKAVVSLVSGKKKYCYTLEGRDAVIYKRLDVELANMGCVAEGIQYSACMTSFFHIFCNVIPKVFLFVSTAAMAAAAVGCISGLVYSVVVISVPLTCLLLTLAYYYTYMSLRYNGYYFLKSTQAEMRFVAGVIACEVILLLVLLCFMSLPAVYFFSF